ncbi:hypothetical protein [Pusillimonas noertemannii]|uniref:Uncharacterized protein n=1 Tax=Pusillimonas noertemannii TaxID=305977 RepID=A0A2U1CIW6_9BURK|nr:hypothetical protein [Pusillimonas noertemannii]NYT69990.1 hypothetical protein [Pusillimonas noertemannii]PVY60941.1 hypothetical protein C7440_3102 [Pusillimonas noertemannii]TFL08401.1 hypothetical protein CSC72_18165 [Pusillimonas noertemannii]
MNLQRCTALIVLLAAGSSPALAAQASSPDSSRADSVIQAGQGVYTTIGNDGSARVDRNGSYKSLSTHGGSQGVDSDAGGKVLRTPPARHQDARRDSGGAGYENYSLGGFISIERGGPQPEGNSRNDHNR